MKTLKLMVLLLALTAAAAQAAPADAWFDMDNCGMCKNLTEDAELFANGLVEITTVPAAYAERHQQMMAKM